MVLDRIRSMLDPGIWKRRGTEPDDFALAASHPLAAEHRMLSALMTELLDLDIGMPSAMMTVDAGKAILALPPDALCRMALAAMERIVHDDVSPRREGKGAPPWWLVRAATGALEGVLKKKPPFTVEQLRALLAALRTMRGPVHVFPLPVVPLLAQVERHGTGAAMPAALRDELATLSRWLEAHGPAVADRRKILTRIDALLGDSTHVAFEAGEPWTDAVRADIAAAPDRVRPVLVSLAAHLFTAGTKPSARWLKEARRLRDAASMAGDDARDRIAGWLAAAQASSDPVQPGNGDFLRGIVWMLADDGGLAAPGMAARLGDLALAMSRKVPDIGMRSVKLLNACVAALGDAGGFDALAQLSRLRAKVKAPSAQRLIAATLEAAAQKAGLPVADLEELVVPTFGMDDVGVRRDAIGDWTAEARVTGTDSVELSWRRGDGKAQKGIPADVARDHAEDVKELKRTVADLAKMLPAQRDRLEGLWMAERTLPLAAWRERYLDHPLVGTLARRLIWRFQVAGHALAGAWHEGALVDADDHPLPALPDDTTVSLWHPISWPVDGVRAWRSWLERHERSQPFKQAHREVYVLTDAERTTATYSNRFAAHILRQHQLAALCRARGWSYALQGWFDGGGAAPTRDLPGLRARVEYWVEPIVDDGPGTESGIALYVSTDQVRFARYDGEAMALADVPPLVFSEAMRDVDLFVGVTSVGADPAWNDTGERTPQQRAYWESFSFGTLSATAESRREVLERLLPKLKVGRRSRVDGRFLVVRGDLRTYRIHLGSGNILMEPNDQYLCIVPARGKGANDVRLPFEGDATLSVILSKAVLLADDTTITDPTITRQIKGV